MSSISYASAAKGQEDLDVPKVGVSNGISNNGENDVTENVTPGDSSEGKESKDAATPAVKKVLAPAPVPTTSAWGTNLSVSSSNSVSDIDEQKWPTPDKVVADSSTQKTQKFIKPITNKWVPIPAKVILPNSRSNQNKSRNRKKKQNNQNKSKSKDTELSHDDSKDADSKDDTKDSDSKDGESKDSESSNHEIDEPNQTSNQQKNGANQQKFVKKFNNQQGANGQTFRKYSVPGQQQGHAHSQLNQSQQSPMQNQNGFFHPQPFNQFQPFNRQFRPNGQFRQGGRNFRQHQGYRNGPMGHPIQMHPQQFQQQQFHQQFHQHQMHPQVQIPPPISPKQNPQEALVQQIDYYFSLENLIRDIYLRKNMNTEGWVSLALIVDFKRIKIIINSIQNNPDNTSNIDSIVLSAIQKCKNLSINFINDKTIENASINDVQLRVKENFEQWLLPVEN